MRAVTTLLFALLLSFSASAQFEFGAEISAVFGSDFTLAEVAGTADGGDGDGIYFGSLTLRPAMGYSLGEVGSLALTLDVNTALVDGIDPNVALFEGYGAVNLPVVGELSMGIFDYACGDGGRYNAELNGINTEAYIYGAAPLGLRLGNDFDGLSYDLIVGSGYGEEDNDSLITGLTLGYSAGDFSASLYAVADSHAYDVRKLFYDSVVSRSPGVTANKAPTSAWGYRDSQFTDLPGTNHDLLQTLALGLNLDGAFSEAMSYHLTMAYHAYADIDPGASAGQETGGSHLFLYPEIGVSVDWFDGYVAGMIDNWSSSDNDGLNLFSPYDGADPISTNLAYEVYAEAGVRLTDDFKVAVGGGYTEPSVQGEDLAATTADDSVDASMFVTPRLIWSPDTELGEATFVLGSHYRQWSVELYDDPASADVNESQEISVWFKMGVSL